jgi:hypothetical protein
MHLLYITFGPNEKNHIQAYFSILSFLSSGVRPTTINVITDTPAFYSLIEKDVNVIHVTPQELQEWRGPHDFLWRIKIKGVEHLCKIYPGEAILYLDTDTFLYGDFTKVLEIASRNVAALHENEGTLRSIRTKTTQRFRSGLQRINQEDFPDLDSYDMWNAGCVLTPNTAGGTDLKLVLSLCDTMLDHKVDPVFAEQYSFGVALKKIYGIEKLSGSIGHYWSNKEEWNSVICNFFIQTQLQCLNETQILERFRAIPFDKIPVKRIKRNRNIRFKKLIDRIFKDKMTQYLEQRS